MHGGTTVIYRPTAAQIDLAAIRDNLKAIRRCLPPGTEVIGIVKADAYGHGAVRVAEVLEQERIRLLAVATPDEAVELREAGIMTEILVLGHTTPDFVQYAINNNITLTTDGHATSVLYAAAAQPGRIRLHYKVDTGMGRAGVLADTATDQILQSAALGNIDIVGLYSHLASAESDPELTARQTERFSAIVRDVRAAGLRPAMVHLANSAGIFTVHGGPLDGVRPGILLYGLPPAAGLAQACPVRPSLSLVTRLEVVKDLPAGHGIGYGRTFVTQRPTRMGLIPIGYADGYPRSLSNRANVLVRGRLVPVVGRVSMDVAAIDVTDVPAAVPGDLVTLIGEQDGLSITAAQLAELAGTIAYEIITGISKRVPRIYTDRLP